MSMFSSITFRLNAFVIGLLALSALLITVVGGTLSTLSFEKHMRTNTFPALMETVQGLVDRELIAPARTLETLAKNPFFTEWIAAGGNEAQAPQIFAMGREFMKAHNTGGMNVILRDNLLYFQLDAVTEKVFKTSKERDPWFFDFEKSGSPLWINIHDAQDPLYPGMIFFNRRIEVNGQFAGNISTGMKMESVLNKLNTMVIGKRGALILARADGSLLTHTNKQVTSKSLNEMPGYEKIAGDILAGRTTEFEYESENGGRKLVLAQKIPVLNLILVSEADIDEMLAGMNEAKYFAIAIGILSIIVGSFVGFLLTRTVTNPLHTIMVIAEKLTHRNEGATQSKGKSTATPLSVSDELHEMIHRKDELGNLARTLRAMVESLQETSDLAHQESVKAQEESARVREAMQEISLSKKETEERTHRLMDVAKRLSTVAEVVETASSTLEKNVRTAGDGVRSQAEHLGETAAAVTEMTSTVLKVAQNASVASETSNITRQRAENGAAVVRRAVSSIKRVQEQSSALKVDMGRLGESAQAIAHIMNVISDIADQTNLLALNAAIEAARAGDAGRGFAVVADEVRKLAEKTMVSTVDVGNAIREIQQSADNSLSRMDAAMESVGEATTLAEESGAALTEIVTLMDNTADQVRAIATAADEQSATSEQINQTVGEVSNNSQKTAQAMHEAAQSVSELAGQARVLTGLIDELNAS